jgi:NAD-dependent SIR2 family protein deacetylase
MAKIRAHDGTWFEVDGEIRDAVCKLCHTHFPYIYNFEDRERPDYCRPCEDFKKRNK